MGKIDLINNDWTDLVFEGKNKEYGAYVLRRDTGTRNVKALIWVLIGIAAIFGIAYANLAIQNAMKQNTTIDTDVELSKLAQKKEAKVIICLMPTHILQLCKRKLIILLVRKQLLKQGVFK